ncbi:ComEC/Rec2 family competence protein [bacterium SCSIO 12643]|nr:ComEC/Rec2 family competence protein [bacterium SCSIO 12643]
MSWLNKVPLIRLLIPFCIGIIVSFYYPNQVFPFLYTIVGLWGFQIVYLYFSKLGTQYKSRWHFGIFCISLFFGIGYFLANSKIEKFNSDHFSHQPSAQIQSYIGRVISEPEIKGKSIKTTLEIIQIKDDYNWIPASGKCLVYIQKDSSVHISFGDVLSFKSHPQEIDPPQNFNEFDYKRYLAHHYIYHRIYLQSDQFTTSPNNDFSIRDLSILIRNQLLQNYIDFGLQNDELALISALTLGKKDTLSTDIKQAYSSAGAMHILAVSGLHVGIILMIIQFCFSWLKKLQHGSHILSMLLILSVWGYTFISGLSPSVLRAATMFSFLILARLLDKKSNVYNTLALSAFAILCIRPYMLLEVGFQLSYLAVIGILYLYPFLYQLLTFRYTLLDKAWSITCVSICAQIATAPLGILYFHQFPSYFLLSNLVIIPAGFLLISIAICFQLFHGIPFISSVLSEILYHSISILNQFVAFIHDLPKALIQGLDISVLETWIIYLLTISVIIWFTQFKPKFVIYTLIFLCCITITQTIEKWEQLHQNEITFYHTGKQFSMEFNSGYQNTFYGSRRLTKNTEQMQFFVFHHWWSKGLNIFNSNIKTHQSPVYEFGNTRILYIDKNQLYSPQQIKAFQPHLIYVNTNKEVEFPTTGLETTPSIIAGPFVKKYTRIQLQKVCKKNKWKLFSLSDVGAIKIKLNEQQEPELFTTKNLAK